MRRTSCALAALLGALLALVSAAPDAGGLGQEAAAVSDTRDRSFLRQSAFRQAALRADEGALSADAGLDSTPPASKPGNDNWSVQSVNECIHEATKEGASSGVLVQCAVQLGGLFVNGAAESPRFSTARQPTQAQAVDAAKSGPCHKLGVSTVSMLFGCMLQAQASHSVAAVAKGVKQGVADTAKGVKSALTAGASAISNAGSVALGGNPASSEANKDARAPSAAEPELGDLLRAGGAGDAVGVSGEAAEFLGRAEAAAEGVAGSLARSLNGSPDGGAAARAKGPARFAALGHEVAVQVSKAADSIERWAEGKPAAGG